LFHETGRGGKVVRDRPTGGKIKSLAIKALLAVGVLVVLVGPLVLYNYVRHIAFWFPEESVSFESADGVRLAGTLVKPAEDGVFPAVVLLHGSGPENIHEASYRAIANSILRGGSAVLLYDKRGVGNSGGDFDSALYRDFVADAVAAVNFLALREDVDAGRIGLFGNSESGWFTPEIAATTGQVAFVFNRVGAPLSWRDTVLWEVRSDLLAAGVAPEQLEPLLDITMRSWSYYVDTAADPGLAEGPERDAINAELKRLLAEVPAAAAEVREALIPYDPRTYAAWGADIGYDPRPFLDTLDIPMMYTFGETDVNVPTAKCVAFLEEFRAQQGKDIDVVVFEGVGHPMANVRGLFTVGYVPEFLELIERWHAERAAESRLGERSRS
jgi:pimeloyl-ACP methyl ester carboxylesterase